ncbi:MAG: NADH-quinone oxidoreductase subunit H [Bdellovibrionales bacterium]|nr:NADH-quinone oxidoreductase subunit H [Bdellovibrionales bacterium]
MDAMEAAINALKLVVIFGMMIQAVPLLVWLERRGSAFIQHRFGPNRVGPLGLLQLLADAVKFINKEEFVPGKGHRLLFFLAPILAMMPGALAVLAIPFSTPIEIAAFDFAGSTWGPYLLKVQGADIPLGIIYIFGVSSLATYPLLLAGWGSSNKFSLMGALRASAQMISYELAMGLAVVGVMIIYGTFYLNEMIDMQQGPMNFMFMGKEVIFPYLPNWGIFYQPLGFLLFLVCSYAEANRLPFDLPEAEGELVAGYHTEYGGFKMLMFFIGEYGHMIVSSSVVIIFYFGGYLIPFLSTEDLRQLLTGFVGEGAMLSLATSLVYLLSFIIKLVIFLWVFIWVRWSLPRFRYDQLMDLGWKTMLPWGLLNTFVTMLLVYLAHG